jgi:methylglutaconyl-CoA hydratase
MTDGRRADAGDGQAMTGSVAVRVEGAVARVVLTRPEKRNAFDETLVAELDQAFASLSEGQGVRVIVLEGEGKAFCAGADLEWMRGQAKATVEENVVSARRMADLFDRIWRAPQAVIAKVHGAALGGGAGLVACADVAVAAQGAQIGFTEARLGILPAVISPYVVAKLGAGVARRWFVTGSRMDAAEAHRIGLVHEVVPEAELDAAVQRIAFEVLQCGPEAVTGCKDLVDAVAGAWSLAATTEDGLDVMKEFTATRIAEVRGSSEGQEGMRAFLEKRRPRWAQ